MLHFGRARNPGLVVSGDPADHLSVEFVNVGGWLTNGDMALDSCAQFLAVAEHRFGRIAGGHAGRCSLEFFRLGRAMRVTSPTGDGGVVHLFVVCGCQGLEEDSEKLLLPISCLMLCLLRPRCVCWSAFAHCCGFIFCF